MLKSWKITSRGIQIVTRRGIALQKMAYATEASLVLSQKDQMNPVAHQKMELANISEVKVLSSIRSPSAFPFRIRGEESQSVEITLDPGVSIRAETGSLVFMTEGVEMEASTGGGFGAGMRRMITGDNFFVADFSNTGTKPGVLALSAAHQSKILPFHLPSHGGELICQKGAFLAGSKHLEIDMFFTKSLKAGFFGGEGFILQRIHGDGLVLIKGGGSVTMHELAAGETLRVTPGALVCFEKSVQFDAEMVKGFKNIMLGGEGLFLGKVEGPGRVWVQSLPFSRLVETIAYSMGGGGGSGALAGGMLGGMMGGGSGNSGGGDETSSEVAEQTKNSGTDAVGAGMAGTAAYGMGGSSGGSAEPAPETSAANESSSFWSWGSQSPGSDEDQEDDGGDEGGSWFGSFFGDDE